MIEDERYFNAPWGTLLKVISFLATLLVGVFGGMIFSGRYKSGKLGSFKAYVTDFKNCVTIKTSGLTFVVSPENPDLFVEILRNLRFA